MNDKMYDNRYNIKIATIVIFILYFFIILGSLNATESATSTMGLVSLSISLLLSTIGLLIYILKSHDFFKEQLFILLITLALLFVSILSILNNTFEMKDFVNSAQMISCFNLMMFLSCINLNYSEIKPINLIVFLFVLFHFFVWIASGLPDLFASIYNNSNLIGPFMFYTSFFFILGIKYSKVKMIYIFGIIASFILIIASDTRSILLSILVSILVFMLWNLITKSKFFSIVFYLLIAIGILSFIFIYPLLPTFHFFNPLEHWMLTHTGKSIMSGRNELWVPLIEMVNQKPLLGYSPGTMASDIIYTDQSPHNLYINVLVQIGYLGLILLFLIFLVIWFIIVKGGKNFIVRLAGSYFIGIMVHQSFEITLFQNQLSIGLLQWFILGIGISVALTERRRIIVKV